MFSFMDVIEVHPLTTIFTPPESLPNEREQGNTIFHWLQLLNLGYRVPGVVNTDAALELSRLGLVAQLHQVVNRRSGPGLGAELVHACEHGNIVMTNGPFLTVHAKADAGGRHGPGGRRSEGSRRQAAPVRAGAMSQLAAR